jgi:hypothetical protein
MSPSSGRSRLLATAAAAAWLAAAGTGMAVVVRHASSPGASPEAPAAWPAESAIRRPEGRFTLVMVLHPRCPCAPASLGELARLMANGAGRLHAVILFITPEGASGEWTETRAHRIASSIRGADIRRDVGGVEAALFHAETSGHAALYDTAGRLVFSGGVTPARAHMGDSPGRLAILAALRGGARAEPGAPVFGCPLRAPGVNPCRK